jgi:predicted regulator of Ras-like GTPase activity (Roadblock/LC7/MglB family)
MFKEQLRKLVDQIDHARGAVIMGMDGLAVEKVGSEDGLNLEALAAEYVSIIKRAVETNQDLGVGSIHEMTVFTDSVVAILKAVTPEYFLVCALTPDGNFGRARFEMRKSMFALERELS